MTGMDTEQLAQETASDSATEAVSAVPDQDETDRLDPTNGTVTLKDGTAVEVVPMKTRQFFRLLRIITAGGATMLPSMRWNAEMTEEEFAGQLLGLVVFSIPEAEDEAMDFIASMIVPVDEKQREHVRKLLDNPELDDTISIIEAVIRREAPDIKALGKRLMGMWNLAAAANQVPTIESMTESSADSVEPLI